MERWGRDHLPLAALTGHRAETLPRKDYTAINLLELAGRSLDSCWMGHWGWCSYLVVAHEDQMPRQKRRQS